MEIKINLIPPYRKEEIIQTGRLKLIAKLELVSSVILVIFLFFLLFLNYIIEINLKMVSDINLNFGSGGGRYEKVQELEGMFKEFNSRTEDVLNLKESQLYWTELFLRLNNIVFEGVDIGSVATKNYSVFLAGKAGNRDTLIKFKEQLERDNCFYEVNLPFSNLVAKDDIDFQIDFKIKKECLRKNES